MPFTLNEASIISKQLRISLDNTIGAKGSENAVFNIDMINSEDALKTYEMIIRSNCDTFKMVKEYDNTEVGIGANLIPQIFYLKHYNLSKFRIFRWIYQSDRFNSTNVYSELVLPDHIRDLQKEYVRELQYVKNTIYILDNQVVNNFVNDIRYFRNINLIEKADIELLKEEFLEMLDELEERVSKGKFKTGTSLQFYISNVNFEATYSYLSSPILNQAMFRLYSINAIVSSDPLIYKYNKEYILSLKKYSTLISESTEMQRIQFFNKQKDIIHSL